MIEVLLIDDDVELAETMAEVLREYSIELHAAHTSEEGFRMLGERDFDIVLLDVMLQQLNGFEVCRKIRYSNAHYKDVSIIMLTARSDLTDMVVGLETGADDYVTKPFEPRELVARINAVTRRLRQESDIALEPQANTAAAQDDQRVLMMDDQTLLIDMQRARIEVNGTRLSITSMEFELVSALAETPGEIMSRDALLSKIHGVDVIYTRSIDALIYRLRKKMKDAGAKTDFIRTIRGRGYSIVGRVVE